MRLESIRNRSGLLMVVIGVAMFAFIMMDLMSSQRSSGPTDLSVGEVYGESIDVQDFDARVQTSFDQQKQSNPEIQIASVRNAVWNSMKRELVFQKEYDASGVSVSNEELFDMIQGPDPYPTIQQSFTNPETGAFDRARLLQYLKEDIDNDPTGQARAQWVRFEEALYNERLNGKYSNAVSKGISVSDWQAMMIHQNQSEIRNVSYVALNFRTIADSMVSVSDSELKEYMQDNKKQYQQDASRTLEYVVFSVTPTKEDDAAAFSWTEDLKADFSNTSDDDSFVKRYSDRSNRLVYQDESAMNTNTMPLFDAKKGTVVGPYSEGRNNYRLAKLVDVKYRPDSVQARHILLTDANALNAADSLKNLLQKGASFSNLANQLSQDKASAVNGGDLGWFPEGRMVDEFNESCFSAAIGELQIVPTQFGVHLIEVTKRSKANKKVKLAFIDRTVVASNETYQAVFTQAGKFAAENDTKAQFDESSNEQNLSKRIAEDLLENTETISGLENPRQLVRWGYEAALGEVSDVMEFGNKFVVATLTKIKEEGMQDLEEVRGPTEAIVRNEKRAQLLMNQLANSSDIATVSSDYGIELKTAEGISFNNNNVTGLGQDAVFVGAAFSVGEGATTAAFTGANAVYMIRIDQVITAPQLSDYSSNALSEKINLQSRANFEVFQALEELAEVKDNRSKFY